MAVAHRVTVDDFSLSHVLAHLFGLILVNPLGERPVLLGDFAIVSLAGDERCGDSLERIVKRLIIEKDPVVVVSLVETVLYLADRASDIPYIAVAGQGNKGGVHTRTGSGPDQLIVPTRIARGNRERRVALRCARRLFRLNGLGLFDGLLRRSSPAIFSVSRRRLCARIGEVVGYSDGLVSGARDEIKHDEGLDKMEMSGLEQRGSERWTSIQNT